MQLFINNWSTPLTASATAVDLQLTVDPAEAAKLTELGSGDHYLLTLALLDGGGAETAWEVVKVTAKASGLLTVVRAQEGTTALIWASGSGISARATKGTLETLRDAGGSSVAPGVATPQPLGAAEPGTASAYSREDHVHEMPTPADIGAATAAQGAVADTAIQPDDLAVVATTGAYDDLSGKPYIPSTPGDIGAATAAQGVLATNAIPSSAKGSANGVATLGADSKIPLTQLPAATITNTTVVATEAAMLALSAEAGDVAVRTDISTSFILTAEPASTLGNWQELLTPSAGGGASVGSSVPQDLGSATPGVSTQASRQDHVHALPDASDVGADAAGTAASAVAAHAGTGGAAHAAAIPGGASGFMSGADKTKLDGVASGATANDTDSNLKDRANHTGAQAIATVTGLSSALDSKLEDAPIDGTGYVRKDAGWAPESGGAGGEVAAVVTESTTSRTLGLPDAGCYIRHTNSGASTVTVTPQADVTWLADTEIHIRRAGGANLTLTPGGGVTLNAPSGGTLVLTNAMTVTLKRVALNEWDVIGQTVAA